jgi:DUF917 family protein
MWTVDSEALEQIAIGAGILGTRGGGNPYLSKLQALTHLAQGTQIAIVDPDQVADDAVVVSVGDGGPDGQHRAPPAGG